MNPNNNSPSESNIIALIENIKVMAKAINESGIESESISEALEGLKNNPDVKAILDITTKKPRPRIRPNNPTSEP